MYILSMHPSHRYHCSDCCKLNDTLVFQVDVVRKWKKMCLLILLRSSNILCLGELAVDFIGGNIRRCTLPVPGLTIVLYR